MRSEYAANQALAASVRQGPSAYRRQQRKQARREAANNTAANVAFVFLFALCFSPMFF